MNKFKIFAFVEECNLGTRVVVSNDMSLTELCKIAFDKIHYTPSKKRDLVVSTNSRWCYALGSDIKDLGEVNEDQVLYISQRDMEI